MIPLIPHRLLRLLTLLLLLTTKVSASNIPCTSSEECESILRPGSQCLPSGLCSNPFHHGGCLKSLLGANNWTKTRICNSEDPPEAVRLGYCKPSQMNYKEVRISSHGWETSLFGAYIIQIVLSELLDVPSSIEGFYEDNILNLYDQTSRFGVGRVPYESTYESMVVADNVQDCTKVTTRRPAGQEYVPCYHMNQELWQPQRLWDNEGIEEHVEPVRELGSLGEPALYVTKNAAKADPTLTSYLGIMGEENRQKLAQTFPRPIPWGLYCQFIAPNANCSQPDMVAKRAPLTLEEANSYFMGQDDLYTGFFFHTLDNDCELNPTNCTGHYAASPCGWINYVEQQVHHLGIGLKSNGPQAHGGYPFAQQMQVILAANATGTPLMLNWFANDALYSVFLGHPEMEFTRVGFAPPTQACVDARINPVYQCDAQATPDQLFGSPLGTCDNAPHPLWVAVSKGLQAVTQPEDVPPEFWSPAFEALAQNYKSGNLQMEQINDYWYNRGTDKYGFDPRDAACRWVVENLEHVQTFVPPTHPRVVLHVEDDMPFAQWLAGLAFLTILGGLGWTYMKRKTTALYNAQTDFLYLVLAGAILTSGAALLLVVPPTDINCQTVPWLINFGSLFMVVPLVTRIGAIHALATSGQQMSRVRVAKPRIYGTVTGVGVLVLIFLAVWMAIDPPMRVFDYNMSTTNNGTTADGEYIVEAHDYCGSEFDYWYVFSIAWKTFILLPGCMMGHLASQVKEDMNDTKGVKWTLYTQFLFLVITCVTYLMMHLTKPIELVRNISLILSIESVTTLGVYILPKLLGSKEKLPEEQLPDVFVNTTIALMDVTGFAAWSSVREPIAVFQMLEKLYASFDDLAEKYSVYKVETVGATYVAATGVPKRQGKTDHAVIMARFAWTCSRKMPQLVNRMECEFGPDTGDLGLRVGMHSGVVTGGFMKGKGARFQLFGDSFNTAMLIQSTSFDSHIHLSQNTANLLKEAGKGKWIVPREEKVTSAEKGEIQTYWLVKHNQGSDPDLRDHFESAGYIRVRDEEEGDSASDLSKLKSQDRWIEWNVTVFAKLLKNIVANREITLNTLGQNALGQNILAESVLANNPMVRDALAQNLVSDESVVKAKMPILEVKEVIELPKWDKRAARRQRDLEDNVQLSKVVLKQLKEYITLVAEMYNPNPFHNFAHASYVVMAVNKYLNRIIAATEVDLGEDEDGGRLSAMAKKHDHTYGITSDPLTHFSCVFSALIHDVDHPGVPNNQLAVEDPDVAQRYQERSLAEQKSLDLAWKQLMEPRFSELRATICGTPDELARFRQLVVNSVMATDLGDKELKELRNGRWEKAFASDNASDTSKATSAISAYTSEDLQEGPELSSGQIEKSDRINRKATIVIEHLIQAADVAHMSQHWMIYRKWNERLFRETYKAFRMGRAPNNPADGWYKGEIGFFDFYIIPLSKKISDCGVFGPTSDENLNYSTNNRNMWVKEGEAIVKDMLARVEKEYDAEQAAAAATPPPKRKSRQTASSKRRSGGQDKEESP